MATCRPARAAAPRMRWNVAAWLSWVPCEKFSRKMSTPAAMSASSARSLSQAGPTVAMIFVRRMYNPISIMGQVVPDAVERYLSSLNRQGDAVLQDIARVRRRTRSRRSSTPKSARCCACSRPPCAPRACSKSAPRSATPASGSPVRCRPAGMLFTMEFDEERARQARGQLCARRPGRSCQRHRRRRPADAREGRRPVRSDFSGRRQEDVRADARSSRRICCDRAACSSPTTCCGTAKSSRDS